ncbi:MAG: response regulator transcription factor [Anaerolineales bacterium]
MIADDHPIVRSGIRSELAHHPDLEVVGEAINGDEVLPLIEKMKPDVLLLDLKMPGIKAIKVLRAIQSLDNRPEVLILSAFCDPENVHGMLGAGARGYLIKDTDPREIVEGIRTVAGGKTWVGSKVVQVLVDNLDNIEGEWRNSAIIKLSPRQSQVLQLLGKGYSNKRIAEVMGIKERMVRYHLEYLMSKLGASNRVEVVLMGIKQGWIEP